MDRIEQDSNSARTECNGLTMEQVETIRGYIRAADTLEGIARLVATGNGAAAKPAMRELRATLAEPGPIGDGARWAAEVLK